MWDMAPSHSKSKTLKLTYYRNLPPILNLIQYCNRKGGLSRWHPPKHGLSNEAQLSISSDTVLKQYDFVDIPVYYLISKIFVWRLPIHRYKTYMVTIDNCIFNHKISYLIIQNTWAGSRIDVIVVLIKPVHITRTVVCRPYKPYVDLHLLINSLIETALSDCHDSVFRSLSRSLYRALRQYWTNLGPQRDPG
jgi:hypothetical protein